MCLFDLKKTLFKVIRGRMELSGKAHWAHAKPIPVLRLRSDIGLFRRLVQGLHKIKPFSSQLSVLWFQFLSPDGKP